MWAIEPILAKLSFENSDFLHTSAIRAMVAALTAFIYIVLTRKAPLKVTRQQLSPLIYIAVVGTLIADFMYFVALSQIPVINAVIIGHMQPIFIIAFGFFLLKTDTLTKFDYLGIALMILSGFLVTTRTLENLLRTAVRHHGRPYCTVCDHRLGDLRYRHEKIPHHDGCRRDHPSIDFSYPALIFAAYLGMTSSLFIANIYQICIGVIIGIGTILYYEGLKRLKAAQVSGLELSTPFFAATPCVSLSQ